MLSCTRSPSGFLPMKILLLCWITPLSILIEIKSVLLFTSLIVRYFFYTLPPFTSAVRLFLVFDFWAIFSVSINKAKARYDPNNRTLFTAEDSPTGNEMTYDKYVQRFKEIMEYLGMNHHPHETRHTFITRAKLTGMDEYSLKLIVGHQIGDVTERVYTHRTIESLRQEIEKIE